jgi:hypothetical protein
MGRDCRQASGPRRDSHCALRASDLGNCDPAVIHRHRCMSRDTGIVFRNWSGARDLNPGPHGPEICAVSSTEHVFESFELISRTHWPISSRFQPPMSPGLLHELLHGPSLVTRDGIFASHTPRRRGPASATRLESAYSPSVDSPSPVGGRAADTRYRSEGVPDHACARRRPTSSGLAPDASPTPFPAALATEPTPHVATALPAPPRSSDRLVSAWAS